MAHEAAMLKVVSTDLTVCGADIKWLSMYPGEAEVLFPPLTYLRPVGDPVVKDGCTVITVHPRGTREATNCLIS